MKVDVRLHDYSDSHTLSSWPRTVMVVVEYLLGYCRHAQGIN